ncbi:hypothetical protein Pmani_034250, partial [Petrolisthes manimaculis]
FLLPSPPLVPFLLIFSYISTTNLYFQSFAFSISTTSPLPPPPSPPPVVFSSSTFTSALIVRQKPIASRPITFNFTLAKNQIIAWPKIM